MQGMTKTIPKLFAMLKLVKVENKKKHQVLMVNKTTSFKKKGKGTKGKNEGIRNFSMVPLLCLWFKRMGQSKNEEVFSLIAVSNENA